MGNEITEANLNIMQFLNAKPKTRDEMKVKRVVTSQGGATSEDMKQELEIFQRGGRNSLESTVVSRMKHQRVHNLVPNGKDVGAYTPKFNVTDKQATSQHFYGPREFLSEKIRQARTRRL